MAADEHFHYIVLAGASRERKAKFSGAGRVRMVGHIKIKPSDGCIIEEENLSFVK